MIAVERTCCSNKIHHVYLWIRTVCSVTLVDRENEKKCKQASLVLLHTVWKLGLGLGLGLTHKYYGHTCIQLIFSYLCYGDRESNKLRQIAITVCNILSVVSLWFIYSTAFVILFFSFFFQRFESIKNWGEVCLCVLFFFCIIIFHLNKLSAVFASVIAVR